MTKVTIESGIAIPARRHANGLTHTLRTMKTGQSFLWGGTAPHSVARSAGVTICSRRVSKRHLRVWKTGGPCTK